MLCCTKLIVILLHSSEVIRHVFSCDATRENELADSVTVALTPDFCLLVMPIGAHAYQAFQVIMI